MRILLFSTFLLLAHNCKAQIAWDQADTLRNDADISFCELVIPHNIHQEIMQNSYLSWQADCRPLSYFDLHIYNRWGMEMQHIFSPSEFWIPGPQDQRDDYYWYLRYKWEEGGGDTLTAKGEIRYWR